MKYIKTFENLRNVPQVGDYIVVKLNNNPKPIARTLETYIGKITKVLYNDTILHIYDRSYLTNFGIIEWWVNGDEILDWSENKEDLEHYIIANKFNL